MTANKTNAYEAKGDLNKSGDSLNGYTYYCYNSENRLIASAGNSACTSPTAALAYDPAGRMGSVTTGSSATNFAYDG